MTMSMCFRRKWRRGKLVFCKREGMHLKSPSSLAFVLTIGDSGLDGWNCSGVVIVLSDNVSQGEHGQKPKIDARWECIDYQPYLEDYIVRTFQFRGFGTST